MKKNVHILTINKVVYIIVKKTQCCFIIVKVCLFISFFTRFIKVTIVGYHSKFLLTRVLTKTF